MHSFGHLNIESIINSYSLSLCDFGDGGLGFGGTWLGIMGILFVIITPF